MAYIRSLSLAQCGCQLVARVGTACFLDIIAVTEFMTEFSAWIIRF